VLVILDEPKSNPETYVLDEKLYPAPPPPPMIGAGIYDYYPMRLLLLIL